MSHASGSTAAGCLSVVMPCFNEARTVGAMVARVLASPHVGELIVIDDGSTDGTDGVLADIDDPRVRVLRHARNRGKGAALRLGFAEAGLAYVIVQDADAEYDPVEYPLMLAPLLDGRADVVYGSRFHSPAPHRVLYFWHSVGNRLLTTLSNMTTNLSLSDMETCFKAFRREVLDSFEIEEDRFGVEPEITAKVARGGWRVYEVGISYAGRTYAEGKKIRWPDGVRALWCIARYARAPAPRTVEQELSETLDNLDRAPNYADWIASMLEPFLGPRVLEVGAGHGTLTDRLCSAGREVTATDVSPRCVAALRRRFDGAVRVVAAGVEDLPAAGLAPFDSVVLVNVLEHVEDDRGALKALRDALVPGGHLVLFVPAFEALYSEFDRRIGHHRRYRRDELAAAVAEAGLEVVDVRYVNALGAVAWWVVATKLGGTPTKRVPALAFDRLAVPVVRRLERRWRPPFGQSVLCVARRTS